MVELDNASLLLDAARRMHYKGAEKHLQVAHRQLKIVSQVNQ